MTEHRTCPTCGPHVDLTLLRKKDYVMELYSFGIVRIPIIQFDWICMSCGAHYTAYEVAKIYKATVDQLAGERVNRRASDDTARD